MHSRLTDELRNKILARLSSETSDTRLATEFEVSRKTIWRLRQEPTPTSREEVLPPANPGLEPIEIPPPPALPDTATLMSPTNGIPRIDRTALKTIPALPSTKTSDITPKVDVNGPVALSMYFAVQLLRGENHMHVAQAILESADKHGVLFRKLQVLDISSVGTTSFVRFRSDLTDIQIVQDLKARAIIIPAAEGYQALFPNGKSGKYPTSSMCLGPKIGFGHTYVGTRIKRWKQQFAA